MNVSENKFDKVVGIFKNNLFGKGLFWRRDGGTNLNALEIYQWLQRLYSGLMDGAKSRQES